MFDYELRKSVEKDFHKLAKKDPNRLRQIYNKILEVCQDPYHYKTLRKPMQHFRRVHIDPFIILYSIDEENQVVIIEDYDHHDKIYKS